MNDVVPYLLQAIGGLLAILTMILAWFGSRIQAQLDEIKKSLNKTERDVREDLTSLDVRVTKIETLCALMHKPQKGTL